MPSGAQTLHCTALPFGKTWHKPGLLLSFCFGLFFNVRYWTHFYFWTIVYFVMQIFHCVQTFPINVESQYVKLIMDEGDELIEFQLGGLKEEHPAVSF